MQIYKKIDCAHSTPVPTNTIIDQIITTTLLTKKYSRSIRLYSLKSYYTKMHKIDQKALLTRVSLSRSAQITKLLKRISRVLPVHHDFLRLHLTLAARLLLVQYSLAGFYTNILQESFYLNFLREKLREQINSFRCRVFARAFVLEEGSIHVFCICLRELMLEALD